MKKIYFGLIGLAAMLFVNIQQTQAQLGINDIIDQYTVLPNGYNDVVVSDSIIGAGCYEVAYSVIPVGGTDGNPNLGDNEHTDYRENMTVTMKLHYAGFQNFMGHADDRVWLYDNIGRMVETNTIHDNALVADEKIFFLNIRGDFDDYKVDMVYYCGQLDRYFNLEDVINYKANDIVGNALDPYEVNMAPLLFDIQNNVINTTIIDANYDGGICLDIAVSNCVSNTVEASDQVCYNIGCENSIEMLVENVNPATCAGEIVSLRVDGVTSMGTGTLTYQWQRTNNAGNWINMSGSSATNSILSFTPNINHNGREYRSILTNEYTCQDTSEVMTLTVYDLPNISSQPVDTVVCEATGVNFSVVASSAVGSLMYQWQKIIPGGAVEITGATSDTYSFMPSLSDNGTGYRVEITDANGCVRLSEAAQLSVSEPIIITNQPSNTAVCEGEIVTFSTSATTSSGNTQFTYQWYKLVGGIRQAIVGETGASYSLLTSSADDNNRYQVEVINNIGCKELSMIAVLTVNSMPVISSQPVDFQSCGMNTVDFEVTASAANGTLTYQWQEVVGGVSTDISGATNALYSFTAQASDVGNVYQVEIMNGACLLQSNTVTLSLGEGPEITTQPTNFEVCDGQVDGMFGVTVATTTNPVTYQWEEVCYTNSSMNIKTSNGLSNNTVLGVYEASDILYAITSGGDFQVSWDGGLNFSPRTTFHGLGNNEVRDVYELDGVVYVATAGGLSFSSDGGVGYSNKTTNFGLGSNDILDVHGEGTLICAATPVGLSVSTNNAISFSNKTTAAGLGDNHVNSVYVHNGIIYAGTDGGLSISTDNGVSFTNSTTSAGLGDNVIESVYVSETGTIYAATFGGLSISTDGGLSYVNKTTLDGLANNISYAVWGSGNLIAIATLSGVSWTMDEGQTFQNLTTSNGLGSNAVWDVHVSGSTIYAGTNSDLTVLGATSPIVGATSAMYNFPIPATYGDCVYQVVVTGTGGCSMVSDAVQLITGINCPEECADDYEGVNMLTGNQVVNADFETRGGIESTQVLDFNAKVDYDATTEIELLPGFEIKIGCEFDAFIDGCNDGAGGNQ